MVLANLEENNKNERMTERRKKIQKMPEKKNNKARRKIMKNNDRRKNELGIVIRTNRKDKRN